ncbi:dehydrogenase [Mangrovitalea sediminis]|uniref:dehydrogenase n=1 Tax=Mangrovitalea sediminis TaxID=1982043 RepID=UPI000BE5C7D3|nr:dehydrogenase [Mangrovitalea sediminis]
MKTVISISLGDADQDYDFNTRFLDEDFRIVRMGCNGDLKRAEALIQEWEPMADAIGLAQMPEHYQIGQRSVVQPDTWRLEKSVTRIPVTTGKTLRGILQEWAVRHAQNQMKGCFDNARILFFSGQTHYRLARVMAEFSDNLLFADALRQTGLPNMLTSINALEWYTAAGTPLSAGGGLSLLGSTLALSRKLPLNETWRHHWLQQAVRDANVVVASYEELAPFSLEELAGKILITSTISPERLEQLRDKGVNMVIDTTPQLFERAVGVNVIEAMIMAAVGKAHDKLTDDDYLDIITAQDAEPRILFPSGYHRVNRFAFVIHPLSQHYITKAPPLDLLARYAPPKVMDVVEKVVAYTPPFLYSRVSGIRSPTGAEVEGWLITVGGTPREILAHGPEFTYKRLVAAAEMAKRLGAQIMGLGAFTKVVGDAGITVARRSPIPITTGNSYSASAALWAAHEALKRLGLVDVGPSGKMAGQAMVVGATGSIGSVCARLLAKAVDEIVLVSPEAAKLLALKESILLETPTAQVRIAAHPDRDLPQMDLVVTATSGAGKRILDIMQVKPGCVITDIARPLDISAEDVAKRPDVLVIESGEIQLPGEVKMRDIGLPPGIAYACLAETIVLAMEGRFENFTLGRNIEWEKVREIYKLGLKHGMKLASISGVNGVYSDADFERVRKLALEKRKGSSAA